MRALLLPLALLMTACATSTPVPSLAGSEWGPVDGTDSFVRFEADGALAANAGCNLLRASYAQTGSALSVDRVASTRKLCEPEVMAREAALVDTLEAVRTARIRDDGKLGLLVLVGESGEELMTLRRRDWD